MIRTNISRRGPWCCKWKERRPNRRTITIDDDDTSTYLHIDESKMKERGKVKQRIKNSQPTYSKIVDKYFMNKRWLNSCISGIRAHVERKGDANFRIIHRNESGRLEIQLWIATFLAMQLWNRTNHDFWKNSDQV